VSHAPSRGDAQPRISTRFGEVHIIRSGLSGSIPVVPSLPGGASQASGVTAPHTPGETPFAAVDDEINAENGHGFLQNPPSRRAGSPRHPGAAKASRADAQRPTQSRSADTNEPGDGRVCPHASNRSDEEASCLTHETS
jgi:hypothetical protein